MDVKSIRLKALMTQEEFAKAIGVSSSTIACWEVGVNRPNISNKRKIVEFCREHGISVRY